jgi:prolyl oligopeptidase PreP (S9A serine peptidase family)
MSSWYCVRCGWENSGSWTTCAKCGLPIMTKEDLLHKQKIETEVKSVLAQIENYRISMVPKWEYLILYAGMDSDKKWKVYYKGENKPYDLLNKIIYELGIEGWELVGVSTSTGSEKPFLSNWTFTFTSGEQYIFKRPYIEIPTEMQSMINDIYKNIPDKLRDIIKFPSERLLPLNNNQDKEIGMEHNYQSSDELEQIEMSSTNSSNISEEEKSWKCKNCGKENRGNRSHCFYCSTNRDEITNTN